MITEIKAEIKVLSLEKFTGHIHFGIENSKICSMSVSSKPEHISETEFDYKKILNDLTHSRTNMYGSIDITMVFGKVKGFDYYYLIRGEDLKNKLKEDVCKNVVPVVKKSNT